MEKENKFCPNCGAQLAPDAKFCASCGQNLQSEASAQQPAPAQAGGEAKLSPDQIKQILMALQDKIPEEKFMYLKGKLEETPASKFDDLMFVKLHEPVHILLFSIFLGGLGVDRFVLGDVGLGIAKLFLGGLTCGIWPLVDIFLCYKKAREVNFNKIMMLL